MYFADNSLIDRVLMVPSLEKNIVVSNMKLWIIF